MEFNEKLQQLRKQKNLTQEELAEQLFVSRTAISKWESGRGYPSIESLKAVSGFFDVSVDDLLSGEELVSLAETDKKEKMGNTCDLVFGILDVMSALMFIIPFFGQAENGMIRMVSLLRLTEMPDYMKTTYTVIVVLVAAFGIAELALQNVRHRIWIKGKRSVSLSLGIFGTMGFIASRQPYAASYFLCMLVLKGILTRRQR
ncbi:helix-turn-helix domain-containing protein [Ruminococcus sp. OA3]|uniref:helix-turn-helix domain-containing protein n=1 Tax=Ruminococcus sp. OA3 TaxID=2914164 RepID=UPI001F054EAD|nr:helix-turn-helix transcriptional regulator [Ruminococcus sp. OA3]MCH1984365.1 helix-turn-helix domain-containing protein [Ruminococcus sp. OA3]